MSYGTVQAEKVTTESGFSLGAGNSTSFKNRLINGQMQINQRAITTLNPTNGEYSLDRWKCFQSTSGKYTVQSSTTAPTGFSNSALITSSAATSLGATDYNLFQQTIEVANFYDMKWGTASASSVTLSFWIRSSLTGTFGGSLRTASSTYNYPFSYTISSADTWEYKTVTIPGPTAGSWGSTLNDGAVQVAWSLGVGSTYSGTANAWTATANIFQPTGSVSLVGTSGATMYITGCQLEVGTVATSFDFRPYGTELALCQRYLYCANNVGATSAYSPFFPGVVVNSSPNGVVVQFPQQMRTQPSTTYSGSIRFTDMVNWSVAITTLDSSYLNSTGGLLYCSTGSSVISASGGVGRGLYLGADGATARVLFSAEL